MRLIGITGGAGMGKSTAARWLRDHGSHLVDTDDLAREVVAPGSEGLAEVVRIFGSVVLQPDGSLNRAAMAARVFGDSTERQRLEAILHPRIHELWKSAARRWRGEGHPLGFVVIPLLFEKGYAAEFAAVVTVACSAATQRQRLLERGWTPSDLGGRLAAQLPIEEKIRQATHVVWTEGSLSSHAAQWSRLMADGF